MKTTIYVIMNDENKILFKNRGELVWKAFKDFSCSTYLYKLKNVAEYRAEWLTRKSFYIFGRQMECKAVAIEMTVPKFENTK